jgi:hypothetical protein
LPCADSTVNVTACFVATEKERTIFGMFQLRW